MMKAGSLAAAVVVLALSTGCTRAGFADDALSIDVDIGTIQFAACVGEVVTPRPIAVTIGGQAGAAWQVTQLMPWLLVDPLHGNGSATVQVGVATRDLAPGHYHTELVFAPVGSSNPALRAVVSVDLELSAPGWSALGGPYSGNLSAIAVDPLDSNRIIVGTMSGFLQLSTDGGASWLRIGVPQFKGSEYDGHVVTAIALLSSGRAFLTTSGGEGAGGVWRSDDRGLHWSQTTLQNVSLTSLAVRDDDRLLVEGDALLRSTDGGTRWSAVPLPSESHLVAWAPVAGEFVVAGDSGTLFHGDGAAFAPSATGDDERLLGFAELADGSWFATTPPETDSDVELYTSADRGVSWQRAAALGAPRQNRYRTWTLAAAGDGLWLAQDGAYVSRDRGATFALAPLAARPLNAVGRIRAIAAHPGGTLIADEMRGLLRANEAQLDVLPVIDGAIPALAFHAATGQLFGLVGSGGVFRGAASGLLQGLGGSGLDNYEYHALSVDPRDPNALFIGVGGEVVQRSTDGGADWQQPVSGIPGDYERGYDVQRAPDDPAVIWVAASYAGLFRSTDNGLNFQRVITAGSYVRHVAPISSTLALYSTSVRRVDVDAGTDVEVVELGETAELLVRTQDGSLWYGGSGPGLHRSTDGGTTFAPLGFAGATPTCVLVDPRQTQRLLVGTAGGLFESLDDGANWREAGAPFPVSACAIDPGSSEVFVGTRGGGVYRYAGEG